MGVKRYVSIGAEATYGVVATPVLYLEPTSLDFDSPKSTENKYPGGLSRFARRHTAGKYLPEGGFEFGVDIISLFYLIYLAFGNLDDRDDSALVNQTDETFTTPAATTTKVGTLGHHPVEAGSFQLLVATALKAHDDGFGNIVADGGFGVTGKITYATGAYSLAGLTAETVYDFDYYSGVIVYEILPVDDELLKSATYGFGKDLLEQQLLGGVIDELTITADRETITCSVSLVGQKDNKQTISSTITLPQAGLAPFWKGLLKIADYGVAVADISSKVEKFTLTFSNNADAEGGVNLNSRFPNRVFGGDFEVKLDLTLWFDSTEAKEDFWGGTAPTESTEPQQKAAELTIDCGDDGEIVFDLPNAYFEQVALSAKGRDRITQELSVTFEYDDVKSYLVKAIATNSFPIPEIEV